MNHYQRLGVEPTATREEIHAAYRALARHAHPDLATGGEASMADINRAWHVLGDPQRRQAYDRAEAIGRDAPSAVDDGPTSDQPVTLEPLPPARVPWRLFLLLAIVGAFVVLVAHSISKPAEPAPIDNLLRPGDCAAIEVNQDAREVPCDDPGALVVVRLVPFSSVCPTGTEAHRDRQGMGTACLRQH